MEKDLKDSESPPGLLSFEEAAKYLGCGQGTLRNWRSEGLIEPVRIGRRVYFIKTELDEFLIPKKELKKKLKRIFCELFDQGGVL